jgi:hypothetical protein
MRPLRTAAVLATVVGSVMAVGAAPAAAAAFSTAATFEGVVTVGCFGCGLSGPAGNGATLWVDGLVHGGIAGPAVYGVTPGNGSASFTVDNSAPDPECLLSGRATGTVTVGTTTGSVSANFVWTRTGANALITIPSWGAVGHAVFAITDPVGDPCGKKITAHIAGQVVGA